MLHMLLLLLQSRTALWYIQEYTWCYTWIYTITQEISLPVWVISSTRAAPVILQQRPEEMHNLHRNVTHGTRQYGQQGSLLAGKTSANHRAVPDTCYPALSQPGSRGTLMVYTPSRRSALHQRHVDWLTDNCPLNYTIYFHFWAKVGIRGRRSVNDYLQSALSYGLNTWKKIRANVFY